MSACYLYLAMHVGGANALGLGESLWRLLSMTPSRRLLSMKKQVNGRFIFAVAEHRTWRRRCRLTGLCRFDWRITDRPWMMEGGTESFWEEWLNESRQDSWGCSLTMSIAFKQMCLYSSEKLCKVCRYGGESLAASWDE